MADPVVLPTLYFIAVVEVVLQALIFLYAYRVSRITGSFRAWTLIVVGFAILAIQNVVGLVTTLTLPSAEINALIDSTGAATIILSTSVNLAAAFVLFFGFYGLVKKFQNQPKST